LKEQNYELKVFQIFEVEGQFAAKSALFVIFGTGYKNM